MAVQLNHTIVWSSNQKSPRGSAPTRSAGVISEVEFVQMFDRVRQRGIKYWADPMRYSPGKINHDDGGRSVHSDLTTTVRKS